MHPCQHWAEVARVGTQEYLRMQVKKKNGISKIVREGSEKKGGGNLAPRGRYILDRVTHLQV